MSKTVQKTEENPDGTKTEYDKNGYVVAEYDKNGNQTREIERNADGKATDVTQNSNDYFFERNHPQDRHQSIE